MKNYLKIKLLFFILLLFISTIKIFAKDTEVYTAVFKKAGFSFDQAFPGNSLNTANNNFRESKKNLYLESVLLNGNYLLGNILEKNYEMVFLVCNSNYLEKDLFSCSNTNFESINNNNFKYEEIVLNDNKNNEKVTIHFYYNNRIKLFVIIENDFSSSTKQAILISYFNSINKAWSSSKVGANIEYNHLLDSLRNYIKSYSFNLLTYFIFVTLFLSIFIQNITYLKNNYRSLNFKKLFSLDYKSLFGIFLKNKTYKILYIYFWLLYIAIFLYLIISKDSSKFQYSMTLLKNIASLKILTNFQALELKEKLFYIYSNFIIFIFMISRVDIFKIFFTELIKKIKLKKINYNFLKYVFVFNNLILIVLLGIYNNFSVYELMVFLLTLDLVIICLMFKDKIEFKSLFYLKEKKVIIFILILFAILSIFYEKFIFKINYKFEKLIGVGDSIVALPYTKVSQQYNLFHENDFKIDYPLFADTYLIKHNLARIIKNTNIKNYDDSITSSFFIVSKSYEELLQGLLLNSSIIKRLSPNKENKLFYINTEEIFNGDVLINIDVDCRYKNKNDFIVKMYYLDSPKKFRNEELVLGSILNCDSENKSYSFKFQNELNYRKEFFIEILEKDYRFIKNFNLQSSTLDKKVLFDKVSINKEFYYFISSTGKNDETVYNYFMDTNKKEYIFDNLNYSDNINILKIDKSIDNSFNIWSITPFRLIVNGYVPK